MKVAVAADHAGSLVADARVGRSYAGWGMKPWIWERTTP